MRFINLALAATAVAVNAQRPSDTPICDYYTTALLKNNTAANQATLLTLIVNTVVIGNYTQPNVGVMVPGILAPGKVNNTEVNLMPYFNGELASTNRGGSDGVSVNFLDGGGADPLKENKPANDETSNQYFLLTHLYQFFGSLLGCSEQGMPGFDAYTATSSMYKVHKFMDLNYSEVTYFVEQVGLTAASFGVAADDIKVVATALNSIFNVRCAPATTVIKAQGSQLQSICIDSETCPLAADGVCSKYDTPAEPKNATKTGSDEMTTASVTTGTTTSSATSEVSVMATGAGSSNVVSILAVVFGFVAFML